MTHHTLVESYFAACSAGGASAIERHFIADAVIFDLNHPPIRGASSIGAFWERTNRRWTGATWAIDTFIADTDAAAIEWTMRGTHDAGPFTVRGSEHYEFAGDLISEIRQYWIFDQTQMSQALIGYPYENDTRFAPATEAPHAS